MYYDEQVMAESARIVEHLWKNYGDKAVTPLHAKVNNALFDEVIC